MMVTSAGAGMYGHDEVLNLLDKAHQAMMAILEEASSMQQCSATCGAATSEAFTSPSAFLFLIAP